MCGKVWHSSPLTWIVTKNQAGGSHASQLAKTRSSLEPTDGGKDATIRPHGRVYGELAREDLSP